ncbi:hypothetical protein F4678DRAFT_429374 [Xylaria arbuscula]|nr:hypothetical protein F4678DRAFT_429374 [Xylaria arbuscula]
MIYIPFVIPLLLRLVAAESVTINQAPAYSSQRPCAQNCFGGGIYTVAGAVAYNIGCDYHNPQNECVCRPDLQNNADAYIQSCVDNECSENSLDVNSAISIYDAYCTGAGFIRNTPATTTSDSPTSSSSSKSQPQQTLYTSRTSSLESSNSVEDTTSPTSLSKTQAPAPTDSTSSVSDNGDHNDGSNNNGSGSNGGGNGLDTGGIIGIVVGILGFVATAIGTWFTYKSIKNKKHTML